MIFIAYSRGTRFTICAIIIITHFHLEYHTNTTLLRNTNAIKSNYLSSKKKNSRIWHFCTIVLYTKWLWFQKETIRNCIIGSIANTLFAAKTNVTMWVSHIQNFAFNQNEQTGICTKIPTRWHWRAYSNWINAVTNCTYQSLFQRIIIIRSYSTRLITLNSQP